MKERIRRKNKFHTPKLQCATVAQMKTLYMNKVNESENWILPPKLNTCSVTAVVLKAYFILFMPFMAITFPLDSSSQNELCFTYFEYPSLITWDLSCFTPSSPAVCSTSFEPVSSTRHHSAQVNCLSCSSSDVTASTCKQPSTFMSTYRGTHAPGFLLAGVRFIWLLG